MTLARPAIGLRRPTGRIALAIQTDARCTLNLAARRGRDRPGRYQHEIADGHTVLIGYRRGDVALDDIEPALGRIFTLLELDDGDQLLHVVHRDRYRRDTTAGEFLDRRLDVLGIVVATANDQQVLDAADDEELSLGDETQVARSQPRSIRCTRRGIDDRGPEAALLLGRPTPVSGRNVVAVHPELADHVLRDFRSVSASTTRSMGDCGSS